MQIPISLVKARNSPAAGVRVVLVRPLINIERNSPFFLPLGLLCIASSLRNEGHTAEIFDFEYLYRNNGFEVEPRNWLATMCLPLIDRQPQVIGITALADTMPHCLLMGRFIKQHAPHITVVLGGPGVFGSFPQVLERFGDWVDYICTSEGELAFLELVNCVAVGERRPRVPGMQAMIDGDALDFGKRPLAVLDELPMPAYDLLPVPHYLRIASPRIFDVYLGSGCTYACRFCVTSSFWDRNFRAKSPPVVLRELDFLSEHYGLTQFNFLHDNFANHKLYLESFIDYFLAHNTRYEWGCAVRPDNVTRDQLERMKRAGCFRVFCGTDSGSVRILRAMAKMPNSKRSYRFFEDCQSLDLGFETNTIIGYPDESDDDLEQSLALVFDSVAYGSLSSDVSVLQPLPGAEVTIDNLDDLVYVDTQQFGTFLPSEVTEIVRASPKLFPGYSFIRKNNRPHEWYVRAVDLVRYFTRHWFRTVFFLVNHCGLRYVALFEQLQTERDPMRLGERLKEIVERLELPDQLPALAESVLVYDSAEEKLKGIDVCQEIENIYSEPGTTEYDRRCTLVDLPHTVHLIFEAPPDLRVTEDIHKPKSYLFFRDTENCVAILCLTPWQRMLWQEMERRHATRALDDEVISRFASQLARGRQREWDRLYHAVSRATTLFRSILGPATSQRALQ